MLIPAPPSLPKCPLTSLATWFLAENIGIPSGEGAVLCGTAKPLHAEIALLVRKVGLDKDIGRYFLLSTLTPLWLFNPAVLAVEAGLHPNVGP